MAQNEGALSVEVVYALPQRQVILSLTVAPGTTVRETILCSGIENHFPDFDFATSSVGIFGRRVEPETLVTHGDRIEIYRPLIAEPKALRQKRARKDV